MNNPEQGSNKSLCEAIERTPAFWEREIANQKASGETVKDYCRERDLSLTTFRYYRYKRKERSANKNLGKRFIPVSVISGDTHRAAKSNDLKIALKNGHGIIVGIADLEEMLFVIKKVTELTC